MRRARSCCAPRRRLSSLEKRGCQVVIIGDRNHAEIKGILGSLESPALVIDSVEELREAKRTHRLLRKVGVIFQTTHALELCREIMNEIIFMCKEVQVINTICRPVQNRQDDALDLAEHVDLMLVVGSRTSANTMELAALCRHHNPYTLHIQNADELSPEDFDWADHVGIASGLSTPEDLVEGVRAKIMSYDGPSVPVAQAGFVALRRGGPQLPLTVIGILVAVREELKPILKRMPSVTQEVAGGFVFHRGMLGGKDVVLLKSGMGAERGRYAAELLIEQFHPETLVIAGFCGWLA